ncbi:hypothetical protein DFH29DRAFT_1069445 [Suillus ampliporus]|nr:hypothetical protein DFH29DRAFT_1069445 [Suillus ampliporus]
MLSKSLLKPSGKDSRDDNASQLLGAIAAINVTKELVPSEKYPWNGGKYPDCCADFHANKCETIMKVLERAPKDGTADNLRGSFWDALSELNISINRINSEVASKKEHRFWQRLFSVTIDRDQIAGLKRSLAWRLESRHWLWDSTAMSRPTEPDPSRPCMFYDHDDLVAELTNLVANDEHIALIGPGGTRKSSLAKAILNETLVTEKSADRRYFVMYDCLDPSTITFDAFMTRFAGALGTKLSGAAHSPSVQKLGENGRRTLAVIAFLPQGLNADLTRELLPLLPQVGAICDVLCMQSLIYRQDSFIKMLDPVLHFVRDSLQTPDSSCLRELRDFYYYNTLPRCSKARDHHADVVISDHFNIVENSSTWTPKAKCLRQLGWLSFTLSQPAEDMKAIKSAEALHLTACGHENVAHCVALCADIQSLRPLHPIPTGPRGLPTLRLTEVWHSRTKLYYEGDIVQVKTHLEKLFLQCQQIGDLFDRKDALEGLADVVLHEVRNPWRYSRAKIHKVSFGTPFGRPLLQASKGIMILSYGSACIELTAGEYHNAESQFPATIESCDMQGNLTFKAYSFCGLGEVAFAHGNFAVAAQRFAETRSLR